MKVMISLQPQLKSIRHAPPGASCHRTHSPSIVALCGRPGGSEREFFDCVQKSNSISVSSPSGISMQTIVASRNGAGGHCHVHGSAFTWRGRRSILQSAASGMMGMVMWGGLLPSPRSAFATTSAITKNEVAEVLENPQWPEKFPFDPAAFERYDEMPDTEFYSYPRFVTHIDDDAIGALTDFYSNHFPASGSKEVAILDICSSWISHYPKGYSAGRISGLGMNEEELKRNDVLTDYNVKDLNEDPKLPYEDSTFDVITNCVSVDYLTKPLQIFSEMQRVLKPGGLAIMSFSNRCFPTKAISLWTSTGDLDHVWIVGSYFHYTPGFEPPKAEDITRKNVIGLKGDPMYVVYARKTSV